MNVTGDQNVSEDSKKECGEGCNYSKYGCSIKFLRVVLLCPCINCIVKPICSAKCNDRLNIYTEICESNRISLDIYKKEVKSNEEYNKV